MRLFLNKETREKINLLIVPDEELILKTKEKAFLQREKTLNLKYLIGAVAAVLFSVCLLVFGSQNSENIKKFKIDYLEKYYEQFSASNLTDVTSKSVVPENFVSKNGSVYCFDIEHKQVYNNIDEIYNDYRTLLVVKGTVVETESIIVNGYVFTKAVLDVNEILKGPQIKTQISFVEYGGCIDYEKAKLFFNNEIDISDKYSVIYNMYNYSDVGDEVIVFLQSASEEAFLNAETDLCVAANFEGKFDLVNDSYNCAYDEYLNEHYNYYDFKNLS